MFFLELKSESALTFSTTSALPSQENPDFAGPRDSVDDSWSDYTLNETDEWDAALDSESSPDPIPANDEAELDLVSRTGTRRFRRRSTSRVRRTPSSWDDACMGGEQIGDQDDHYYDDEVEDHHAGDSVAASTESNRILEINGTLHVLRHSLFVNVRNKSVSTCSARCAVGLCD